MLTRPFNVQSGPFIELHDAFSSSSLVDIVLVLILSIIGAKAIGNAFVAYLVATSCIVLRIEESPVVLHIVVLLVEPRKGVKDGLYLLLDPRG